ncbi:hypothetical protein O3S80_01440 [Streptomyces sp. Lzd4kr]|nr:hypothetical protein [Streptomyces sp. Lzd4kr]
MTVRGRRQLPDRPRAVCVMHPGVAHPVFPLELRARLSASVRLAAVPTGPDLDAALPAALADADILISGRGCPPAHGGRLGTGTEAARRHARGQYGQAAGERGGVGSRDSRVVGR